MLTFVVAEAGADEVGVLRMHQVELAPAARLDPMLGSCAQVPLTEPAPTAAAVVQAAVEATGQALTATACASATELPETTETVVDTVPGVLPVLANVTALVTVVTLDEKVVVMALVPLIVADILPMVTLEAAVAVAL
ncbi:hypothetical protein GCM10025867_15930 [Frondihabitans sucicola]|uniref:Uncharacterized protein n=1 Tax=Frondihabitans sucicola TaxID=1268041 RepID=A0ABM8GLQ8_9MICO|nr:hypothetical protein GCM10025867_15930 [Frondihabitans sucicola]